MVNKIFEEIYNRFVGEYGLQHWWPTTCEGKTAILEIMVGAILTQNTAWKNVEKAIVNMRQNNLLDVEKLIVVEKQTLALVIRPAGYFNRKAERLKALVLYLWENYDADIKRFCQKTIDDLREELLSINGIGKETADSILLYALGKPIFVVDAYTRRIFSRLGLCRQNITYDEMQGLFLTNLPREVELFNEYHALIVRHAKEHCRKIPFCKGCPTGDICNYRKEHFL